MAEKKLHPDLVRIRDRYPASKCLKDRWEEVKRLVNDGKSDEAEAIAKKCVVDSPILKISNAVAVRRRRSSKKSTRKLIPMSGY